MGKASYGRSWSRKVRAGKEQNLGSAVARHQGSVRTLDAKKSKKKKGNNNGPVKTPLAKDIRENLEELLAALHLEERERMLSQARNSIGWMPPRESQACNEADQIWSGAATVG